MLASTAPLFPRQSKAAIHLVVEVSVRNENMGQFLERAKLLQPRQFSEHMLEIICPNDAETTKKLLMVYHEKIKLDDQPKTAQEFYGELRWLKCLGGDALVREEVKRVVIALIKSMAKNLTPLVSNAATCTSFFFLYLLPFLTNLDELSRVRL